jgi:[protein-PII] uridylyltransferase
LERKTEQLIAENASDIEIAKTIKKDHEKYIETLPQIYAQDGGKAFLLRHTSRMDSIIKLAYKVTARTTFGEYMPMKNHLPITVAAMGSYGREQLCVHSDVDIMFVYEKTDGYSIEAFIEKMLYLLWDMGLKLGHRAHELSQLKQVAKTDITIKSAILESRFVEGSKYLWTKIENQISLIRKDDPKSFIKAKLQEQRKLHDKFPLTMEPNIKEGVGGFRDANLVFWIGKLLYNTPRIKDLPTDIVNEEDYRKYRMALEFLFRVRSALHLATSKKEDRLRMEYIPQIATLLGYDNTPHAHMRFAKKTTESLRIIYLYSKIWLEALVSPTLPDPYNDMLLIHGNDTPLSSIIEELNTHAYQPFRAHPKTLADILHAQKPQKLTKKYHKIIANIFRQTNAYATLRTLHISQLLSWVIPPLRKVSNLPQFDGYHKYSVDIHSLQCLWFLENINDEELRNKFDALNPDERQLLKIVGLLHDAGKGRKKPHALVGASLFRIFAQKLGLKESCIQTGVHLIQYHDVMSRTAQREDLYNEKTIFRFASLFGSKKMLDMIHLLTYADMSAVGEGIYTEMSGNLLKTLYHESVSILDNKSLLDSTARRVQKTLTLQRSHAFKALDKKIQKEILSIASNEFYIHHSTKDILAISQWGADTIDYKSRVIAEPHLIIEISRKKPLDLGYLLSKLYRLNILSLDIYKLFGKIKFFRIIFSESIDDSEMPLIEQIIEEAFGEHQKPIIPKPDILPNELTIDCNHSRDYAAMRLHTKDQKGLLAYLAQIFEELRIDVASTKIHTRKHTVNDLFLIEKDGNFCHNTEKIINALTE